MAVLRRTRFAQYPMVAEFVFNYTDGMTPLASLSGPSVDNNRFPGYTDFGSGVQPTGSLTSTVYTQNPGANTSYFEVLTLPLGAQVIGGDIQVETPYVCTGTATLTLGDSDTANLYSGAAAINLKATNWTNPPTGATNAVVGNPGLTTYTNATANGISAVGQTVTISGMTPAAYNGTFVVESYTATSVTVYNPALTAALTYVSGGAGTYMVGRTALQIPDEYTNLITLNQNYGLGQSAEDAAAGLDIRMGLTFGTANPAASAGRVRIRVMYTIDGRSHETATQ